MADVTLTTHSCDGISPLDIALAGFMDKIARGAEIQRDHGVTGQGGPSSGGRRRNQSCPSSVSPAEISQAPGLSSRFSCFTTPSSA